MRKALRITATVGSVVLAAAGGLARGGEVAAGQSVPLPRPERPTPAAGMSGGSVVGPYIGAIGIGANAGREAAPAPSTVQPPSPTRGLPPLSIRDPAGESRLGDDRHP